MRLSSLPLALLLAPSLALADTLLVGPEGSGAPFSSLPDAVAAAAPGDTVLVLAGEYHGFVTLDIDKPLTLLGAGSDVTSYEALPTFPWALLLPLHVHDLAPGEEVRVAGLHLASPGLSGTFGPGGAVISACAGPVVLADVSANGSTASFPGNGVFQVLGSAQVLLDGCSAVASAGATVTLPAQPALRVEGSSVHVNGSFLRGSDGPSALLSEGADGAPGLIAEGSTVRISRSVIQGGAGKSGFFMPGAPHDGAPAIASVASTVLVRGGPSNSLHGGSGSAGQLGGLPAFGSGAPAVVQDGASFLTVTPDAGLVAGADGDGEVTAPVIEQGGGALTLLAERLATLAAAPSVAHPGGLVTLGAAGEPAGAFLSFFSFGQAPALAVPGIPGVIVLNLGAYAALPALILDGAGLASLPVAVPPLSALAGTTLLVQGLSQSPPGTLSISSPAFVGIAQ